VLINDDGYIVLTDFGMAKHVDPGEKCYSFAGTPEYIGSYAFMQLPRSSSLPAIPRPLIGGR